MDCLDLTLRFIERCRTTTEPSDLRAAFQQSLHVLGFRYFACCSHVDPLRPPRRTVMLLNYPTEWVRTYSEGAFHRIDPVFHRAERAVVPFTWDAAEFRGALSLQQEAVLSEGMRFGVAHGYTIPFHVPFSRGVVQASCSVVPDSCVIDSKHYFAVELMAGYLFDRLSAPHDAPALPRALQLSPREKECIELVAQGKTDWEVGQVLGISEHTVHNHLEHAKKRFGVINRVQVTLQAIVTEQIVFGDVVRPLAPSQTASTNGLGGDQKPRLIRSVPTTRKPRQI